MAAFLRPAPGRRPAGGLHAHDRPAAVLGVALGLRRPPSDGLRHAGLDTSVAGQATLASGAVEMAGRVARPAAVPRPKGGALGDARPEV